MRRAAAVYTCCSHNYLFILFGTMPKKKDHEIPKTTDYLENSIDVDEDFFNILESNRCRVRYGAYLGTIGGQLFNS